jgi:hypothetical protein
MNNFAHAFVKTNLVNGVHDKSRSLSFENCIWSESRLVMIIAFNKDIRNPPALNKNNCLSMCIFKCGHPEKLVETSVRWDKDPGPIIVLRLPSQISWWMTIESSISRVPLPIDLFSGELPINTRCNFRWAWTFGKGIASNHNNSRRQLSFMKTIESMIDIWGTRNQGMPFWPIHSFKALWELQRWSFRDARYALWKVLGPSHTEFHRMIIKTGRDCGLRLRYWRGNDVVIFCSSLGLSRHTRSIARLFSVWIPACRSE